ncbi:molecular chaperone TorD family protein [Roseomonas sp. GC11]|uniref:TorD/DmsD family molecular chaperone n=1 Tax=Roseomonas sp. GC11 TaxID=2950546 RepID=UPI00210A3372|nr:molecular chaperone TorD family protein [Roseomonas sp. GC11]MCQ4158858.1 molecular chaperone TorD family protein [Roseomonas sp. GC11]
MTLPVPPAPELDLLELERARLFALLGRLLAAPPDGALLANLRALQGRPDTLLGRAYAALSTAARATDLPGVEAEFHALFTGAAALHPVSSAFLPEAPSAGGPPAALLAELERLGVGRAPGVTEPEDHLGVLCETLAGLIAGVFPAPPEEAGPFFTRHMQPWAGRCFAALEAVAETPFYRAVGALGTAAMEVEAQAVLAA